MTTEQENDLIGYIVEELEGVDEVAIDLKDWSQKFKFPIPTAREVASCLTSRCAPFRLVPGFVSRTSGASSGTMVFQRKGNAPEKIQ